MKFKINLDGLGITTSILCAIHCALLPLLFTSLPLLGVNIIHNNFIEFGMIFLSIGIGVYALVGTYKSHHNSKTPIFIFLIGSILLIAKEFFHDSTLFYWLLFGAIACIIAAHSINYYFCRIAKKYHTHTH